MATLITHSHSNRQLSNDEVQNIFRALDQMTPIIKTTTTAAIAVAATAIVLNPTFAPLAPASAASVTASPAITDPLIDACIAIAKRKIQPTRTKSYPSTKQRSHI